MTTSYGGGPYTTRATTDRLQKCCVTNNRLYKPCTTTDRLDNTYSMSLLIIYTRRTFAIGGRLYNTRATAGCLHKTHDTTCCLYKTCVIPGGPYNI